MTAGWQIREIHLCSIVATRETSNGYKHHQNRRADTDTSSSVASKCCLFSQVSRERALYQLLLGVSPVISKAHGSILVFLREGAMEQQSLKTKTHIDPKKTCKQ